MPQSPPSMNSANRSSSTKTNISSNACNVTLSVHPNRTPNPVPYYGRAPYQVQLFFLHEILSSLLPFVINTKLFPLTRGSLAWFLPLVQLLRRSDSGEHDVSRRTK